MVTIVTFTVFVSKSKINIWLVIIFYCMRFKADQSFNQPFEDFFESVRSQLRVAPYVIIRKIVQSVRIYGRSWFLADSSVDSSRSNRFRIETSTLLFSHQFHIFYDQRVIMLMHADGNMLQIIE